MVVTDRQRRIVQEWATRVGDEEVAEALMELLPPVGWGDLATKRDLDHLGAELRNEFRADLSEGLRGVERAMRVQLYWVVGSIWSALGVALAFASLR